MGQKIIDGDLEVTGQLSDDLGNQYATYVETTAYTTSQCLPHHKLTLVKSSEYDEPGEPGTEIIFTLNGFAIDIILNAAEEVFHTDVTMEQIVAAFNDPDTPADVKSALYQGLLSLWSNNQAAVYIGTYDGSKVSYMISSLLAISLAGYIMYIDGNTSIVAVNITTYDRISFELIDA